MRKFDSAMPNLQMRNFALLLGPERGEQKIWQQFVLDFACGHFVLLFNESIRIVGKTRGLRDIRFYISIANVQIGQKVRMWEIRTTQ